MSCAYLTTCTACGACSEIWLDPEVEAMIAAISVELDDDADDLAAELGAYPSTIDEGYCEVADPETWSGACHAGE